MSHRITSLLAVSALVLTACGSESSSSDSSAPASDALTIAASFYPLSEIVETVTNGLSVKIVNLTPPGVGAHDHELTANQLDDLTTVDAVFYLGGGLQPSVEKAVAQLDSAIKVTNLADYATTIDAAKEEEGRRGDLPTTTASGGSASSSSVAAAPSSPAAADPVTKRVRGNDDHDSGNNNKGNEEADGGSGGSRGSGGDTAVKLRAALTTESTRARRGLKQ